MEPDFSGWATKAGLKCSDGRTIMPNAFKHQDKMTVPLVWQHGHNSAENVLGHAVLENRDGSVYCYGFFNDTPQGGNAKLLVQHEDIKALSIYANQLVEKSKQVIHGAIREVSLVLSGANPGALIDYVRIAHSNGDVETLDDEAVIYTGLELEHADMANSNSDMTVQDVYDTFTEEQLQVVHYLIGAALDAAGVGSGGSAAQSGLDEDSTPEEVYNSFDDLQKELVHSMIEAAVEEAKDKATAEHSALNQEGTSMAHNVFEQRETQESDRVVLSHSDMESIARSAVTLGSFKEAVEDYALKHGITNIDVLFPDARSVTNTPDWNKRRTEWVASVLDTTNHSPFSRIKSTAADLTLDEARAKGYVKGTLKQEEFFSVSKRVTTPQTVYKKQKLDRDDIVDITDFDVVVWLKGEMRLMLDEEIAGAILIGDGRSLADPDKIKEDHIRPIATDSDFYQTTVYVNIDDANSSTDEIVDAIVMQRRHYKGTGTPTFYTTEDMLAKLLLAKDTLGRRLYPTIQDLAAAIRVKDIVAVEIMDRDTSLVGVIVNLQDYTLGADRGGDVSLFDDFDIDYNQYKYLIEARLSGALTKPKSALVVRKTAAANVLAVPTAPTVAANVVTIPTDAKVVYKDAANATLTQGSTITLTSGAPTTTVYAVPAAGYYFATNQEDQWTFTYKA